VALNINGYTLMCFIDTGSEATLIKPSILKQIDPDRKLCYQQCNRAIQGVTGSLHCPQTEVFLPFYLDNRTLQHCALVENLPFPGDVLLGVDLLRKVRFTLSSEADLPHGTLTLGNQLYSVVYTDTSSLHISLISTRVPNLHQEAPVHLLKKTEILPHTGRFLEAVVARAGPADGDIMISPSITNKLTIPYLVTKARDRKCSIWALNAGPCTVTLGHGTRLGTVSEYDQLYSKSDNLE